MEKRIVAHPINPASILSALESAIDERMLAQVETLDLSNRRAAQLDLIALVDEFGPEDVIRWLTNIVTMKAGRA